MIRDFLRLICPFVLTEAVLLSASICFILKSLYSFWNFWRFRMKLKDCLRESWYTLSNLSCFENYEVAHHGLKLLDLLSLPQHQPLSGIYTSCQNLITAYFNFLQRLSKDLDNDGALCFEFLFLVYLISIFLTNVWR